MPEYIKDKSIVITGAASGFGKLVAEKAARLGAKITCADINEDGLTDTVEGISASGGTAQGIVTDVTDAAAMRALAKNAIDSYGRIDVMINNAGVMPLAFYADHAEALDKWHRCIDINFKGVVNGISAVYDQMMSQEEGQVINISSIYGNFPVTGAAVYGATKAAVNFLSESLRVESRGKIKVTTIKPTGVPATGLAGGVVNAEAVVGILGQNTPEYMELMGQMMEGKASNSLLDPEQIGYALLDPGYIADQVIHAINQPLGVSLGDITVRASGDHFIL